MTFTHSLESSSACSVGGDRARLNYPLSSRHRQGAGLARLASGGSSAGGTGLVGGRRTKERAGVCPRTRLPILRLFGWVIFASKNPPKNRTS